MPSMPSMLQTSASKTTFFWLGKEMSKVDQERGRSTRCVIHHTQPDLPSAPAATTLMQHIRRQLGGGQGGGAGSVDGHRWTCVQHSTTACLCSVVQVQVQPLAQGALRETGSVRRGEAPRVAGMLSGDAQHAQGPSLHRLPHQTTSSQPNDAPRRNCLAGMLMFKGVNRGNTR